MFKEIQDLAYFKESQSRSIRRLIETPKFQSIFLDSGNKAQQDLFDIVEKGDLERFKNWLRMQRQNQLALMQTKELREKAEKLGILNFSTLTKNHLIHEITVKLTV